MCCNHCELWEALTWADSIEELFGNRISRSAQLLDDNEGVAIPANIFANGLHVIEVDSHLRLLPPRLEDDW